MILDLESDRLPADKRCDVLIVGGGPAGIVLALELAGRRPDWRVVLAEGGGREWPRADEQDLYRGETVGKSYRLESSRLRFLGGTSNHWGGWCRPLDEIDFEPKPHMPHTGWPFGKKELAPYYRAAHRWCEIAGDGYDPAEISARHPGKLLDLSGSSTFRNRLFRFSPPTRFGTRYAAGLDEAPSLDVLLHANAVTLRRTDGRVRGAELRSLNGTTLTIEADVTVLAMGGLETARFVLNQAESRPGGIGLSSPWVGRGFADHFGMRPGLMLAPAELGYLRMDDVSGPVMPILTPTEEAIRERGWQNVAIMLMPTGEEELLGSAYASNQALGFSGGDHWLYAVQMILEPVPDPESRVTLAEERDALGLRRLRLGWRIGRPDYERAQQAFVALTHELARLGLARGRLVDPDIEGRLTSAVGSNHHLGTLRMAADPHEGVVDPDLRVHGEENLYVLGSATFPSYGYSNPTLTIVALAVRLAETLGGSPEQRS